MIEPLQVGPTTDRDSLGEVATIEERFVISPGSGRIAMAPETGFVHT
jgi:hypothetical protein